MDQSKLPKTINFLTLLARWIATFSFLTYCLLSFVLFEITGINARSNLYMWMKGGQGIAVTLREIVPNPVEVGIILLLFCFVFGLIQLGMRAYRYEYRIACRTLVTILIGCMGIILAEQILSLNFKNPKEWAIEQDALPLYMRLVSAPLNTEALAVFHVSVRSQNAEVFPNFQKTESAMHPPIFIYVVESFAKRFMTPYNTPNFFTFARDSVQFENSIANGNATYLSWFSIFTGEDSLLEPDVAKKNDTNGSTAINTLRRFGYVVRLFDSDGFNFLDSKTLLLGDRNSVVEGYKPNRNVDTQWDETDMQMTDRLVNSVTISRSLNNQLYLVFPGATHFPYLWPGKKLRRDSEKPNYLRAKIYSSEVEKFRNQYRQSLQFVDQQFGRFIHALKLRGEYDKAIVIVTGDHGEELFENGNLGHGSNLSREQIETPILFKLPSEKAGQKPGIVSQTNIMPTLLYELNLLPKNSKFAFSGDPVQILDTNNSYALTSKAELPGHQISKLVLTMPEMKIFFELRPEGPSAISPMTLLVSNIELKGFGSQDRSVQLAKFESIKNLFKSRLSKVFLFAD